MTVRNNLNSRSWRIPRSLLRHGVFAVAFTFSMAIIADFGEPGAFATIIGFPAGVAALWALMSPGGRVLIGICGYVFVVSSLSFVYLGERAAMTVWLGGLGYVVAGPMIRPVMKLVTDMHTSVRRPTRDDETFPLGIIAVPADVYRLLISTLIAVPMAVILRVVWGTANGLEVTRVLVLTNALRDVAGIILVAGVGLAIASCGNRNFREQIFRRPFIVVVVATALLVAAIFGPGQSLPIVYLAIFPLFWSATTSGVPAATLHATVTVIGVGFLAQFMGAGPFAAGGNPIIENTAIQLFTVLGVVLSLVVSTAVQQRTAIIDELEALTETIPDPLVVIDRSGTATPVNAAGREVVMLGDDGWFLPRPLGGAGDLAADIGDPGQRALEGERVRSLPVAIDDRVYSLSASPLYGPRRADPEYALLLYRDVSNEYRRMHNLRRAHAENTLLFEEAPQGLAGLDKDGRILQANKALADLLQVSVDELTGRQLSEFSPDGPLNGPLTAALAYPGQLVYENRTFRSASGETRHVELSLVAQEEVADSARRFIVNAVDTTEQVEIHEQVAHLADHDELTGLMNRRRFNKELYAHTSRSAQNSGRGALMLIDLDNFKLVNDYLGHQAGDELLVEFAAVLRDCVGPDDVVARFGGDEFVVLLPNSDHDDAVAVGSAIVETVRERFGQRDNAIGNVTASIGITSFVAAEDSGSDPLVLADQLLYDAKHAGKSRFAVSSHGEPEETRPELVSRSRVEKILAAGDITLHLQPVVAVNSGEVVLAEALLRAADSSGPLNTRAFVDAVELAGRGPDLDTCVVRQGIRLLPRLLEYQPDFRLLLNLSGQSLMRSDVARVVVEELQAAGVPGSAVILEITESAQVSDFDQARAFQEMVRGTGVVFAVDDFGAGYDPYRYLVELEIDMVKIAGEFVESMTHRKLSESIVRSLAHLAQEQGMTSIAEFVSDESLFSAAQGAGVDMVQGYHLGRPVPLETFIREHLVGR